MKQSPTGPRAQFGCPFPRLPHVELQAHQPPATRHEEKPPQPAACVDPEPITSDARRPKKQSISRVSISHQFRSVAHHLEPSLLKPLSRPVSRIWRSQSRHVSTPEPTTRPRAWRRLPHAPATWRSGPPLASQPRFQCRFSHFLHTILAVWSSIFHYK